MALPPYNASPRAVFRRANTSNTVFAGLDRVRLTPSVRRIAEAGSQLWFLLFPVDCAVCGAPSSAVCPGCLEQVRKATVRPFRAEREAFALPRAEGAAPPGEDCTGFEALPVTAAGHYRSSVALLLLAYKNRRRTDVVGPLQAALAGALHSAVELVRENGDPGQLILVPVPSRRSSLRRRGYDPLGLMLARLSRRGELPAGCRTVRLVAYRHSRWAWITDRRIWRRQLSQKGLGSSQRRVNVHATMRAAPGRRIPADTVCLVVDDVLTTGATIAEVVRVLRAMGAAVAGGAVVAATPAPSRRK